MSNVYKNENTFIEDSTSDFVSRYPSPRVSGLSCLPYLIGKGRERRDVKDSILFGLSRFIYSLS
jgi:hypothetical protein